MRGWKIQSSALAEGTGAEISRPGYSTAGDNQVLPILWSENDLTLAGRKPDDHRAVLPDPRCAARARW